MVRVTLTLTGAHLERQVRVRARGRVRVRVRVRAHLERQVAHPEHTTRERRGGRLPLQPLGLMRGAHLTGEI